MADAAENAFSGPSASPFWHRRRGRELSRSPALLAVELFHLSRKLMRRMSHLGRIDLLAQLLMQRCDVLGKISDDPGKLTRTFVSPAM